MTTKNALDRFWAEEKFYFERDRCFSPLFQLIYEKLSGSGSDNCAPEVFEGNELNFKIDWSKKTISAEFMYSDPQTTDIIFLSFEQFIKRAAILKASL
ncbi:MAG: hypothetical protein L3J33_09015 [Rhodobacteraceae bacterium]|nr:hypothetical protein [Paracoccaceae bacterium]